MYAIIVPRSEKVKLYKRKLNAIYDHITYTRRSGVSFKEHFSTKQRKFYERMGYSIEWGE